MDKSYLENITLSDLELEESLKRWEEHIHLARMGYPTSIGSKDILAVGGVELVKSLRRWKIAFWVVVALLLLVLVVGFINGVLFFGW